MCFHRKCAHSLLQRADSFGSSLSLRMDEKSLSVEILGLKSVTYAQALLKTDSSIIMGIPTSPSVQLADGSQRADSGPFSSSISKTQKNFRDPLLKADSRLTVHSLRLVKTTNISQPLPTHTAITSDNIGSRYGNAREIPSISNTRGRCQNSPAIQDSLSLPMRTVRLCWQSPENVIPKSGNSCQSNPSFSQRSMGFPAHFTPDSRYLFAGRERNLQILEWQTNTPLEHPSIRDYFDMSRDGTVLLSYAKTGQIQIWDGTALLPSQPVAVDSKGKQIVILGAVKRNQLLQNFPNPFNPETWIPFQLADESDVTIHIYTTTGQLVRHLSLGRIPAGDYSSQSQAVYWDGRNQTGEPVSSGVYFYTINADEFSTTRKMLIQK